MYYRIASALAFTVVLFAAPGMAQESAASAPAQENPVAATADYNRGQAEFARKQLAENAASRKAHDEAVKSREAQIQQQQSEYEAEKAKYDAAMKRWQDDVAACEAGNYSRCAAK